MDKCLKYINERSLIGKNSVESAIGMLGRLDSKDLDENSKWMILRTIESDLMNAKDNFRLISNRCDRELQK